jgi:hypothetical protein
MEYWSTEKNYRRELSEYWSDGVMKKTSGVLE